MAVIDLGSNSWRLVVYMFAPGDWWKLTDEIYETVRIGAGLAETGRLSDAGMGRGLETLAVFERFLAAHGLGPDAVHAVATSAIRDATNGEMFLKAARAASGLNIEVISDEDEARFGYVAAINSSTITDGIVLETGGGSIQLIEVADRRAQSLQSFPLGAVRLTEQFLPGQGPARKRDLQKLRAHVRESLAGFPALAGAGDRIVGMGGAVRNLAAAAQRMIDQPDIGVQGFVITRAMLAELVQTLAELPVDERGEVPGIKVGRGDIILASALVIETVVELGSFEGIEVTEASLRDGVFITRELLADSPEPLFEDVRVAGVRNLAIQYESDLPHVEHVALLSLQMFDSLVGRRPVRAQARRARAAVGRRDAPRRRHDDLLRRPPQALVLPDRQRRAPGLRSARARADRPDHPLSPQGRRQARRDGGARRARRRRAARPLLGDPPARRAPRARPRPIGP